MSCFFCAKAATGVCRFCGRGVCSDHASFGPYVIDVVHSNSRGRTEALVVEDAVKCGACKPRPQPVPMPELD